MRNGADVDGAPLPLRCYPTLALGALSPAAGPVGGGTGFVIVGGPYARGAAHCRLGAGTAALMVPGTALEHGVACATTPPLAAVDPAAAMASRSAPGAAPASLPIRMSLNGEV